MVSEGSISGTPNEPKDDRWTMQKGLAIVWDVTRNGNLPHEDHLEMSGRLVSIIVRYGVDDQGNLILHRHLVWPTLRKCPNDTHASLSNDYDIDINPQIRVNGEILSPEKTKRFTFDGLLTIDSSTSQGLDVTRTIFPAVRARVAMERFTLKNTTRQPMRVEIDSMTRTDLARGSFGVNAMEVSHDAPAATTLLPGEEFSFGLYFSGRGIMEKSVSLSARKEEAKRRQRIERIVLPLRFESPDPILNRAFDFAKIRAAESVFETRGGLMHCPGGGPFYAAVWCNDQVEYAGPFFPFLGDEAANEASLNAYRLYMPWMAEDYKPIPSSIIAEGLSFWNGAGDRGDAAMYAYGASRFALACGDRKIAEELFPAIEWCLEYCRRKMTAEGVIASDCDELERRFPAGSANLSTSTLTYGGLRSAADLARSLNKPESADEYDHRAETLARAIEKYFGAKIEGFDTYRYYDGNEVLRAWICLPLTMGLMDRRDETIRALFSPRLWTENGLATQAGEKTFWDRSTLYGLRGVFLAGETETAMRYFKSYTRRRLLGEHVPYAVEAWPEGGQRHLSAESALYCRVVTEGLFGIVPVGLNSFRCTPRLPAEWDSMALKSIRAFGGDFDLEIKRLGEKINVVVTMAGRVIADRTIPPGETIDIHLPE